MNHDLTWRKNNKAEVRIMPRCLQRGAPTHFDWMTCLTMYRERDCIEKEFMGLKNELAVLPLKTHSDNTTRGYLFIAFLSLILRSSLLKIIKDSGIIKKYSVERVFLELDKWRKITLADGQVVATVMIKKQRTILETLKLARLIPPGN